MLCSDCEFTWRPDRAEPRLFALLACVLAVTTSAVATAAAEVVSIQDTQLDNGLRLVTRCDPSAATFAIAAAARLSAAEEAAGQEGLRELVELCLSSTGGEAASAGVLVEAQTRPDLVTITARAPGSLWQAATDAVIGRAFMAHFDSATIRAGQRTLGRLAEAQREMPLAVVERAGVEALYPASARHQEPTVARLLLAPAALERFYREHFVPNNIILVASGPVDAKALRTKVAAMTAELLPGKATGQRGVVAAPLRPGTRKLVMDGVDSAVWVGARAPRPGTREYRIAVVAMTLLANGMGSRLYRRLRDELSLAYLLGGQVMAGRLWPYMYVSCTCEAEKAGQALAEIEQELDRAAREDAADREIERAREVAATQLLALEMSNWRVVQYLSAVALLSEPPGRPESPSELAAQVRQVRKDQVREFVRDWWTLRATIQLVGG